jgi:hypothetical protein
MAYTVTTDEALEGLWGLGVPTGFITDLVTGVTSASFKSATGRVSRVALDVPLCDGCDEALTEGACRDCDHDAFALAPVYRLSETRIAA